jgi:hypothetical protein
MTTMWRGMATTAQQKLPKRKTYQAWNSLLILCGLVLVYLVLMTPRQNPMPNNLVGTLQHLDFFLTNGTSSSHRSSHNSRIQVDDNHRGNDAPYSSKNSDPFYNISSDGTNLWDDPNTKLPEWMKAYMNWHKDKRQKWNTNDWESERWLIMQCLADQDKKKCGGTADRLKPLPFILRVAYESQRILLIRWTRPALLEEFLVPPKDGFDWRVPERMAYAVSDIIVVLERSFRMVRLFCLTKERVFVPLSLTLAQMSNVTNGKRLVPSGIIRNYAAGNMSLIRTRYQSFNGGSEWYDSQLIGEEAPFNEVFYDVWRTFFRPSKAVAAVIQSQMKQMALIPGAYVSTHLRALYAITERDSRQIEEWTRNALNCASVLRQPGFPIFFASDSAEASNYARVYAGENGARVVTHTPNPNPPLHLDRCRDWQNRPTSDFYDTFVDLYLIALGGCVTYNRGGYGHWGLLIGGDYQCFIDQGATAKGRIQRKCMWLEGNDEAPVVKQQKPSTPLFLEAME